MLTKVEATSASGVTLAFPLEDISNGFIVEDIEGLDPVKATIVSSGFAGMDGKQYQASRLEERNIIIKLDLEPDWTHDTVRSLRKRLSTVFRTKSEVTLRFTDTELPEDVFIVGRVESCGAPLFTAEPKATISVLCDKPSFWMPTPTVISGTTTSADDEIVINYDGDEETGILFHMDVNREITSFSIYQTPPDNTLHKLDFALSMTYGDMLDISTVPRAKGATLTRAGSTSPVVYGVTPYSSWLMLQPGANRIRVYTPGTPIPYKITYTTRFGGL